MRLRSETNTRRQGELTFYPYRTQILLSCLLVFATIQALLLLFVVQPIGEKLLAIFLALCSSCLALGSLPLVPLRVVISEQGISIRNTWTKEAYETKWCDLHAVYCMYDRKGHLDMLFALKPMDESAQKAYRYASVTLRKGRPQLEKDGCVCFRADLYWEKIECLIRDKIAIIGLRH